MFVAVIGVYFRPAARTASSSSRFTGLTMDPTTEHLLFLGFFFAFAVKAPMFPAHLAARRRLRGDSGDGDPARRGCSSTRSAPSG